MVAAPAGIDPARLPAEHVQRPKFRPQPLLGIDLDQHAALGAVLVDMASLDIAGKNDFRLAVEHFVPVGVPQGPVIVVFGNQARDGAGGVRLMPLAAGRTGVQAGRCSAFPPPPVGMRPKGLPARPPVAKLWPWMATPALLQ